MDEYMTETELAERLKVSRTFLWAMRTSEGLPHCRIGRAIRYSQNAVTDWLSRHHHENTVSNEDPKGDEK